MFTRKRRKGFTLVELLIVLIIIGVVASMALMNSGSGVSMSKATAMVSDLRTLKSAALMFYTASTDAKGSEFNTAIGGSDPVYNLLGRYLANPEQFSDSSRWFFVCDGKGRNWHVGASVDDADSAILEELSNMSKAAGLLAGDANTVPSDAKKLFKFENGAGNGTAVYMRVR